MRPRGARGPSRGAPAPRNSEVRGLSWTLPDRPSEAAPPSVSPPYERRGLIVVQTGARGQPPPAAGACGPGAALLPRIRLTHARARRIGSAIQPRGRSAMPLRAPRFRSRGTHGAAVAACLALAFLVPGRAGAGPAAKQPPTPVAIDLVPGDPDNRVVLEAMGSVEVAVLGASCDVATIDAATLRLADAPVNKERVRYDD